MSKEENKTVEEINEDERVNESDGIEEGRAIEIPIERREDEPVLRGGGLRGIADPHMIQTHLDNFLAMLCGETPIDNNVRTSIEYWLKRLADGEGGSTKKIYYHPLTFWNSATANRYVLSCVIIDNDPTAYTWDTFKAKIETFARIAPMSGSVYESGENTLVNVAYAFLNGTIHTFYGARLDTSANYVTSVAIENLATPSGFYDGVNAIN